MIREDIPTDKRFDMIVDSFLRFSDKDSLDGKFSYKESAPPSGKFTVTLGGTKYKVSIAPAR